MGLTHHFHLIDSGRLSSFLLQSFRGGLRCRCVRSKCLQKGLLEVPIVGTYRMAQQLLDPWGSSSLPAEFKKEKCRSKATCDTKRGAFGAQFGKSPNSIRQSPQILRPRRLLISSRIIHNHFVPRSRSPRQTTLRYRDVRYCPKKLRPLMRSKVPQTFPTPCICCSMPRFSTYARTQPSCIESTMGERLCILRTVLLRAP